MCFALKGSRLIFVWFWHVLFGKDFGYIHAKPLLLVPFTEYPSSPSLYICRWWAGRRRRLDVFCKACFGFLSCRLDLFYVGKICVYVGESWRLCFFGLKSLYLHMSALEAFWSRFWYVFRLLSTEWETMSCMSLHLIYAQLLWTTCILIYCFRICEPDIYYTLIVFNFESWPSVISDYWPSRHQITRGGLGSWDKISVNYSLNSQ